MVSFKAIFERKIDAMRKVFILICVFTVLFSINDSSWAELSGKDIMERVFNRDDGADQYAVVRMVLVDRRDSRRERMFETFTKDYGVLVKGFLEFLSPADIEGTSFLSWENENKDDTQYLYLPALGRARRIVSGQKSLRFVNTDYTYEDMQRRNPEKDQHSLLKEEILNSWDCFVIESIPKKGTSQYGKRVNWVDKVSFIIVKTDFFDKKNKKNKEFKVEILEKIEEIWTAINTVMIDLKEGHKTFLNIEKVKYNQNLKDRIFTERRFNE